MKKATVSLAFILVGSGLWFALANTARFSIKKWDAKFETVLRHGLDQLGVSDRNLLSSVHQIRKDAKGEWVTHEMTLKEVDLDKVDGLKTFLEKSGAQVTESLDKKGRTLLVKRGSRVYQEIRILP